MTKKTLMAIQVEDAARMASEGDLPNYSLAGTGKTLSTLEAFKLAGHQSGLVLGPSISLSMWKEEIETWLGATAQVIRAGNDDLDFKADFIVAPYDLAAGSMRARLYKRFTKGALILDEADRLRRHTSKRTAAVFGTRCDCSGGFAENFDQVWSLTGNPVYRFHDDLWSQLRPLFPNVLERYGVIEYEEFVNQFCVTKLKKHHPKMQPKMSVIRSQNEAVIRHILYNDIKAIRRLEAPDLPELVTTYLFPSMMGIPAEYGKMVNNMTEQDLMRALVSGGEDDEHFISMQKVWQTVAIAKVKGIADYVQDVCMQAPVLIGVWHDSVGQAYYEELTKMGLEARRVYGATPANEREQIRDLFNSGSIDCIIGQMQAMGVSWNLQKSANRVIIAQDHFSPAIIEQFYKRVYRTGQENKTHLDILTSEHPLDMAIKKIRNARAASAQKSLG